MAHVKQISMYSSDFPKETIDVVIAMKPSGEARLSLPFPKGFAKAIIDYAQKAADAHEAQMRLEILGDEHTVSKG